MQPMHTLSRQLVLDLSPYLQVETHSVKLPDGRVIEGWPWLISPDFVNVAAITEDGLYLCFRQTKYSIDGTSLAPVGGYLEPGEDPLEAAKRELQEEMGYQARHWEGLGTFAVDGNRGNGKAHFFLARGAYPAGKFPSDDLEQQQLLMLTRPEVEAAFQRGAFKVLPWQALMALALLRW